MTDWGCIIISFFAGKKSHSLRLVGYQRIRYEGKGEGMREMRDLTLIPQVIKHTRMSITA